MKTATSRSYSGQLPGTKRSGNWWNSRSTSMKATGRAVAWSWLRMNEGFMEMVSKRKASKPSGAWGPNALEGSCVALQQTP